MRCSCGTKTVKRANWKGAMCDFCPHCKKFMQWPARISGDRHYRWQGDSVPPHVKYNRIWRAKRRAA